MIDLLIAVGLIILPFVFCFIGVSPQKVSHGLRTNRQPRDIWGRYESYQVKETAWIIGPDRL